MIAFRDFAPQELSRAGLLKPATYEPLADALTAANRWIEKKGVEVFSVETVVLPNLWSPHSEGTEEPNQVLLSDFAVAWNQFIRVWYRVPEVLPEKQP